MILTDNKSTGKLLLGFGPNSLGKGFIYHLGLGTVLLLIYVEGMREDTVEGSRGPGGFIIINRVPGGPAVRVIPAERGGGMNV